MNFIGLLGAIGLTAVSGVYSISTSTMESSDSTRYSLGLSNIGDLVDLSYYGSTNHPTLSYCYSYFYVYEDGSYGSYKFNNLTLQQYRGTYTQYEILKDVYEDAGNFLFGVNVRYVLNNQYTTNNVLKTSKLRSIYFQFFYGDRDICKNKITDASCTLTASSSSFTEISTDSFFFEPMDMGNFILLKNMSPYTRYLTSNLNSGNSIVLDYDEENYITSVDDAFYYLDFSQFSFGYNFQGGDVITLIDTDNSINNLGSYGFALSTNIYNDSSYKDGYTNGFIDGYSQGNAEGTHTGYENGYNTGYDTGKTDGIASANDYSFLGLFGAVADTPVLIIRNLFNFDFFGVNLLTVVLSLFTGVILFYLLRKLL